MVRRPFVEALALTTLALACGPLPRSDVPPRVASHVHVVVASDDPRIAEELTARLRDHGFRVDAEVEAEHRRRGLTVRITRATSPNTATDCALQVTLVALATDAVVDRVCTTSGDGAAIRLFEGIAGSSRLRDYAERSAQVKPREDARVVR